MATLLAIERYVPPYRYAQEEVSRHVEEWRAEDLATTEQVLGEHGNMSSVTVLFVLDEIVRRGSVRCGEKGLLGAFGPGFGAEFALVEFC